MSPALPVKRGCGTRLPGAVYLECGTNPDGSKIESFLFDPPETDVPSPWLAPHRTPLIIERDGVHHVVIWVGAEHYPNVWDYVEEVRVAGSSRRVSSRFPFEKLSAKSRQYFVHVAAHVTGRIPEPYDPFCPTGRHRWEPTLTCLGLAKYLLVRSAGGYRALRSRDPAIAGPIGRILPCGHEYMCFDTPPGTEFTTCAAVFLWLPLTGITVVRDTAGRTDEWLLYRTSLAGLRVTESDV